METGEQIQRKILRFITSLRKLSTKRELTVIVTHYDLIARLLKSAGSEMARINPGERVSVEVING